MMLAKFLSTTLCKINYDSRATSTRASSRLHTAFQLFPFASSTLHPTFYKTISLALNISEMHHHTRHSMRHIINTTKSISLRNKHNRDAIFYITVSFSLNVVDTRIHKAGLRVLSKGVNRCSQRLGSVSDTSLCPYFQLLRFINA